MNSSHQKFTYNGELVDQAYAILNRNDDNLSPDQASIIQGAVETISNHMEGVNSLTKVEYVIIAKYIARLHETERYLFTNDLANIIAMTRPTDRLSEADFQLVHLATVLADVEVEKQMNKEVLLTHRCSVTKG
ncbi:hypothetical protein FSST1_007901 [Fusarium sambucinum]